MHAELTLGLGLAAGHNQVELLLARVGTNGLLGNRRPRYRHETRRRLIWWTGCSVGGAESAVGRRHHRAPHLRRPGVLRGDSRYVLPASRGAVDQLQPDRGIIPQRAVDGDRQSRSAGRHRGSQRSRHAIHFLGLHRTRQACRAGPLDELDRRWLQQRDGRSFLGKNAIRTLS